MTASAVRAAVTPWPRGALRGAELVARQREHARRVLASCSPWREDEITALAKDERGAPLPRDGWHWSVSHCRTHVAACVHRAPVGVDVEDRADVRVEIVERVLSPAELSLFERRGEREFFLRAWTAKEAVLKELGVGLAGLSRCAIVDVPSDSELLVEYDGQRRRVWQLVRPGLVVAISSADGAEVVCRVSPDPLTEAAGHTRCP